MASAAVLITFAVGLILTLPIGIALMFACGAALLTSPTITADSVFIYRSIVTGMDSFTFLAIPLFVLSGNLMAGGGISNVQRVRIPSSLQKNSASEPGPICEPVTGS